MASSIRKLSACRLQRARTVVKVAIADDSALIYSDDYRKGWIAGFAGIGCEVRVFDIAALRRSRPRSSVYSSRSTNFGRMIAKNIAGWGADLVWCHHGLAASSDAGFLEELRKHGITSAVYLCDEPYETGETVKYSPKFDAVFTMDLWTLDVHRNARDQQRVYHLPPAVDVARFRHKSFAGRERKALFLGNADLIPRREWLEPAERIANADIRYFPHRQANGRPIAKGHSKWVGTEDHPELYASCTVGLNVHRSPVITKECFNTRVKVLRRSQPRGLTFCEQMPEREGTGFWNDGNLPASHINPRFFEMAACGTCVVNDNHRSELTRLFPFVPQAVDPANFLELVLYYLDHVDEAEEIGRECSFLISGRHTYQHRACEVLILLGFKELLVTDQHSYLGEPAVWLNPQDCNVLKARSLSGQIGLLERWSPQYGMSLMRRFGNPKGDLSIDVHQKW